MLRRSFLQTIAGGIAAIKSYAGVKAAQARVGSPTGWKITWQALPSGQGRWIGLPETADRQIAFMSVTSAGNDKIKARKRVVAMIQESKNGKNLLPMPSVGWPVPAGFDLTKGYTSEYKIAEAERLREKYRQEREYAQRAFSEGRWKNYSASSEASSGRGFFAATDGDE